MSVVQKGFVGSSAKKVTGYSWMSQARLALGLKKQGWMSEMVGKTVKQRSIIDGHSLGG